MFPLDIRSISTPLTLDDMDTIASNGKRHSPRARSHSRVMYIHSSARDHPFTQITLEVIGAGWRE